MIGYRNLPIIWWKKYDLYNLYLIWFNNFYFIVYDVMIKLLQTKVNKVNNIFEKQFHVHYF